MTSKRMMSKKSADPAGSVVLSDGCGGTKTDSSLTYSLATDGKSNVLQYANGITDMLVANEVRSKHVEMGTQSDGTALVCLTAPSSGIPYALTMPTELGSGTCQAPSAS